MAFFNFLEPWESGKFHLKYKAYNAGTALNTIATSQPYLGITKYEIRAAISHPPAQNFLITQQFSHAHALQHSDTSVEATGSSPPSPIPIKSVKRETSQVSLLMQLNHYR